MHLSVNCKPKLPKRFPIGTTYVIEGRGGEHGNLRVFSRYVVLPSGQRFNLADDFGGHLVRSGSPRARRRRAARRNGTSGAVKAGVDRPKKIAIRAGTTRQRRR